MAPERQPRWGGRAAMQAKARDSAAAEQSGTQAREAEQLVSGCSGILKDRWRSRSRQRTAKARRRRAPCEVRFGQDALVRPARNNTQASPTIEGQPREQCRRAASDDATGAPTETEKKKKMRKPGPAAAREALMRPSGAETFEGVRGRSPCVKKAWSARRGFLGGFPRVSLRWTQCHHNFRRFLWHRSHVLQPCLHCKALLSVICNECV
jgi:hypothetical protein